MPREKQRRNPKAKSNLPKPQVDPLTVVWVTTIATTLMCEVGAGAARLYVHFADPHARLLEMFSAYLLLTAAVIGFLLMLLTPIVVRRKRSNPPGAFVAAAYIVGGLPWLAMLLQGME